MTDLQKLEIRLGEIRQRLATIGALPELSDETRSELDKLLKYALGRQRLSVIGGMAELTDETRSELDKLLKYALGMMRRRLEFWPLPWRHVNRSAAVSGGPWGWPGELASRREAKP